MIKRLFISPVGILLTGLYLVVPGLSLSGEGIPGTNTDVWFNLQLNGGKIGYFHFSRDSVKRDIQTVVLEKEETFMKFRRSNRTLEIRADSSKELDITGKLLNFSYRMNQGNSNVQVEGESDYDRGTLRVRHIRGGSEKMESLDIETGALTEYQALQRLGKQGFKKGSSLRFRSVMIERGGYINVNMQIEEVKAGTSANRGKTLYKVVRTLEDMPGVRSETWLDSELVPYSGRLIFPNMQYSLEITSREEALKPGGGDPASITLSRVKLKNYRAVGDRESIKKVSLLLKLHEGDAFPHDLDGGIQEVVSGDLSAGLRLVVDAHIPEAVKHIPVDSPVEGLESYLKPNALIESDNEKIISVSRRLLNKESAWATALNIKVWVRNHTRMNFNTGFASAVQALESGEGDCTEHAVLTAALCRAAGIPARVAVGYTLSVPPGGEAEYVGHMWNEIYINGMWVPVDATSSRDSPNPFNIRFFSGSLDTGEIMKKIAVFPLTRRVEISLVSTF